MSLAYLLTQLSIAIGNDNREGQKRVLGNTNYLILVSTIVTGILVFVFSRPLIAVFSGGPF